MAAIPFVPRIDDAPYATSQQLSPLVRRVIAENPSKFTYRGTGTYIIGTHDVVVVDPGPRLDSHRDALQRALEGLNVVGIVVTHCHADHSPLAQWLKQSTGAPTYALGPHADVVFDADEEEDDDDDFDEADSQSDEPRETIDTDFQPDITVADGEVFLTTGEFSLLAVATPGHTSNHLCVALPEDERCSQAITSWVGAPLWCRHQMATWVSTCSRCRRWLTGVMRSCIPRTVVRSQTPRHFSMHMQSIVASASGKFSIN